MRGKVSRETIARAVREEIYLKPGVWIQHDGADAALPVSARTARTACRVCAVGAVIRRVVAPYTPTYAAYALAHALGAAGDWSIAPFMRQICGVADAMAFCPEDYDLYACLDRYAEKPLRAGWYMAALSAYYEGACVVARYRAADGEDHHNTARERTAEFVEKRFPAEIELDFGDVVPNPEVVCTV